MSQILYRPVSTEPSRVTLEDSADTVYYTIMTLAPMDLFVNEPYRLTGSQGITRRPKPAIQGTVSSFHPKIHDLVPELESLTENDLEDLIGEKFPDFEDD